MRPRVSVIIPLFDDEDYVEAAIASCLAQTVGDIEVICIDDASTDATCERVEAIRARDLRVRLIRQEVNRSAFQARRAGILAAQADRVLFLDGDDELAPKAVQTVLSLAESTGADLVGFGVEGIMPDGGPSTFVKQLQPTHKQLLDDEIMPALFPADQLAQGQLWRYLWDISLLRSAYDALPDDLELYRANDIPIAFLAIAAAKKYVSTKARLYRYYWRRGGSGQQVQDLDGFRFYLGALDSIAAIAPGVEAIAGSKRDPEVVRGPYRTARLSVIQSILRYCVPISADELRSECFAALKQKVERTEILLASATFHRAALPFLAAQSDTAHALSETRNVLIVTGNLGSGGVQGVVVSQAQHLAAAGFRVTVAVRTLDGLVHELPDGVELVEIAGKGVAAKLDAYLQICRDHEIDVIIDHWVLYNDDFAFFSLGASAIGIPTIGWIHNFALRPLFDFNTRSGQLTRYLPTLAQVVVLSRTDVAFWKMRGIEHVVYLPNPPSPMLLDMPPRTEPRPTPAPGTVRLAWWGRMQQHTKRVRSIVDVAAAARALGLDVTLTIIGPDSPDLRVHDLVKYAEDRGVADVLELPGPLHGDELVEALEHVDVYVGASAIEGYPLVLTEAQAIGLPVAMFELPWLAINDDNEGLITSPQGDAARLARSIADVVADPELYTARSLGSLAAARAATAHDFDDLYARLLHGDLPGDLSPEPTVEDAKLLLRLVTEFSEANVGREARKAQKLRASLTARQASSEPALVRGIRPAGRAVLRLLPGMRPLARRFNRFVRRR